MSNEVRFRSGTHDEYAARLKAEGGVDASAIYFVTQDIQSVDGVDFGGTIYRGADALGTTCADHLKTVEDIQIAGGPLANNVAESNEVWPWKDEAGNKIIPAGKSVQEILSAMFLKVVNGTVKWGTASWSPSLAKPTVTLSSNGPVEVGSTVTISALSAGAATAGSRSVSCTCSQGYFEADEDGNATGSHKTGNKSISVAASVSGDAALACTWNGTACDASAELVVVEGTNTVKAAQSGQTASCEALPTTKVFGATNTKSLLPDVSATFTDSKPADRALTSENTDTIKGSYKYFIGYYGDATFADKTYTVEGIRTTDKKQEGFMDGKNINTTITVAAGTKGMYIAIPEGVDNTGASLNVIQTTALNTPVGSEMAANVRSMDAFACAGTATKNYKVFTWSFPGGTAGEETFSITSF